MLRDFLLSNTISVLERLLTFFRPVDPKDRQIAALAKRNEALEERNEFLRATLANEIPDFDIIRAAVNPDADLVVNTLLDTMRHDVRCRVGMHSVLTNQASANARILAPIVARTYQKLAMRCLVGVQPMTSPVAQIHVLRVTKPEDQPNIRFAVRITKDVVEAKTRKLSTHWFYPVSEEPLTDDLMAQADTAAADAIAGSCAAEIDQGIYHAVRDIATPHQWPVTIDALVETVGRLAEDIRETSMRGRGNVMIVSHAAYRTLATHQLLAFRADTTTSGSSSMIQPVGWLNIPVPGGTTADIRVYANFLTDRDDTTVLIGYKGSEEMDAGYFYCPYSMVTTSGVVLDPDSLMPVMHLLTRFGEIPNGNLAPNYFRTFALQLPSEA